MRVHKIELLGRERLLCFSARTVKAFTERYGAIDKIDEALFGDDPGKVLDESLWMLAQLMDGGVRYAKMNGIDCAPALTQDELYDGCDLGDIHEITQKIIAAISGGSETNIETVKNVETTPEE